MSMHTPNNALDLIVARKRVEVARAREIVPLQRLKLMVAGTPPPRNFFAAVVHSPAERALHDPSRSSRAASNGSTRATRIIAEIKRSSPSAGVIREDFDPVRIAKQYEQAGAAAISCLTDEVNFGGHLGYIAKIKQAVAGLPVLRKDFIVDEYQVWESRVAGADAVLLIAEVLPEGELMDLMILCRELGMTSLVEAHDADNLLKVRRHIGFPHAGYSLLGINNRDLRTMKTDLSHTLRMLELVEDRRVLVSESGIRTGEDLDRLAAAGVEIVLVGEHLLRQPDPGEALKHMLTIGGAGAAA